MKAATKLVTGSLLLALGVLAGYGLVLAPASPGPPATGPVQWQAFDPPDTADLAGDAERPTLADDPLFARPLRGSVAASVAAPSRSGFQRSGFEDPANQRFLPVKPRGTVRSLPPVGSSSGATAFRHNPYFPVGSAGRSAAGASRVVEAVNRNSQPEAASVVLAGSSQAVGEFQPVGPPLTGNQPEGGSFQPLASPQPDARSAGTSPPCPHQGGGAFQPQPATGIAPPTLVTSPPPRPRRFGGFAAARPEPAAEAPGTRPSADRVAGSRVPSATTPPAQDVVEQRSRHHLEYGQSLARRGSTFAAREEFVQALRLITEARDMQAGNRQATSRLADGLRALTEARDFLDLDARQQLTIDLGPVMAAHRTPVARQPQAHGLRPIQALQAYYRFATTRIADAVGESSVAADTLYAMGKLQVLAADSPNSGVRPDRARAMVMFQASLAAQPGHYRSANELGVLMARNGKWPEACRLFRNSLKSCPTPEAWVNLARTHQQLGEPELARLAENEYRLLLESGLPASNGSLAWVTADQFEPDRRTPGEVSAPQARTADGAAEPAEDQPVPRGVFGSFGKWF